MYYIKYNLYYTINFLNINIQIFYNMCSGGVFAVLLVGLVISIIVSMFEFYYYRKGMKHIEQVVLYLFKPSNLNN